MGTAGPLGLAREILDDGSGDPFFVLNRCRSAVSLSRCSVQSLLTCRWLSKEVPSRHRPQMATCELPACTA